MASDFWRRPLFLAFLTAFGCVLVTLKLSRTIDENHFQQQKHTLQKNHLIISSIFEGFVHGLQGMNGVYVVSHFQPTLATISKYSKSRDDFKNFKGAMGFGFIRYVRENESSKYRKIFETSGIPIHRVQSRRPVIENDQMIIEAIEPFEPNRQALGLDVGSEMNRREAALQAAETAEPTLTRAIQLVQVGTSEPGFLFFLPLYRTITPPQAKEQRLRELVGWSYSPITKSVLQKDIDSKIDHTFPMEIVDADPEESDEILFQTSSYSPIAAKGTAQSMRILVGGRAWILRAYPRYSLGQWLLFFLPYLFLVLALSAIAVVYVRFFRLATGKLNSDLRAAEAEDWNTAVLNGSDYSIISTSPDGTILTFNRAAEKMLGYAASELIGKFTPALIHDPAEVIRRTDNLSQQLGYHLDPGFETFVVKARLSGSDTNEWSYVAKSGEKIPVRLCVTALRNSKGDIIGYLGIAENISEEVAMRDLVEKQQEKMIASSKMSALGEMAGGIAHEINNPLAIIIATCQYLKIVVSNESLSRDTMIEPVERLEKTAQRIGKIISGLRLFSRNSEDDPMHPARITDIIDDTLELCAARFRAHRIRLTVASESSLQIHCRATQISQVLMNLLNNAFDAVNGLDNAWVSVECKNVKDRVHILVTDSGHGIPDAVARKIMNPFFTTKDVGKGTGLGLSISLGITRDHGGELSLCKSSLHTQFLIDLPAL